MAIANNKNTKTPGSKQALFVIISAVVVASGYFGWIKLRQGQEKDIQQARILLEQLCQSEIPANTNVLETYQRVNEVTNRLHRVPNIPGLPYQKAQDELNNFSTCIKSINAQKDFVEAQRLSQKALLINDTKVLDVKDWHKISSDLDKAIILLKNIPQDTSTYDKSQKELKIYQNKLKQIHQKIQNEELAANAFKQAENFNQEADDITNQSSSSLESLSEAEFKIKSAIETLKDVSNNTNISQKIQNNLLIYQNKLKDIQYQISTKKLKPLVKRISNFASSLDVSIGYNEYSKQVKQLKDEYENLTKESPAVVSHPGAKALAKALNRYNDALIVWRYCHEGNCLNPISAGILDYRPITWLPASFAIKGKPLLKAYPVELTSNIFGQKFVQQDEVLTEIWNRAAQDIKEVRDQK